MENETPNQFLDDYAKKLLEPIKKRESDKASIYGAIGGALVGGLGAYLISPKDKSKKKYNIENAYRWVSWWIGRINSSQRVTKQKI